MVAPNWNTGSPRQLGIEHLDVGYGHNVIDAPGDVGELQFDARATGAVDTIELHAGSGASAGLLPSIYNSLPRPMLAELVPAGQEAWGPLAYNDYGVTAVTGTSGMFNENLTTPITASRLNAFDDDLFIVSSTLNSYFYAQFNTAAFALDRHVLAVEVVIRVNLTTGVRRYDSASGTVWSRDFPVWTSGWASGAIRWGEAIVEAGASTWKHWTPQMVRDFASGGTRKVRITCRAGPGYWKMDRLYLRVFSIPERRRGVGIGSPTSSFTWIPFSMQTPNATGAPSITTGEDMTLMVRRITDYSVDNVAAAVLPWRYLRGRAADGTWRQHTQPFTPTINTASNGKSLMGAAGAQIDGIPAARLVSGGSVTADAMPYSLSRGALVYGAQTASQFLTAPAGTTVYGQAFVVAGWVPNDGRPAAPLRAELYRVSDGLKILDAVEITAADVDRLPVSAPVNNIDDQGATYKTLQFRFPSAADLSTGQHELRLSSPNSTATRPWRIAMFAADYHTTDQTFGGATDYGTGNMLLGTPAVSTPITQALVRSSDLQARIVEVPAAVTGVGVSNGSLTAHHVDICSGEIAGCEGCAEDTMPYVQVSWSAAPSGTPDIAAYHIDRMDDLDPDWKRVGLVVGRTTTVWNDHEVSIGIRSQYRVRVLRTDAVVGDWSTPASITVPTGQVALAFSSNAATGMGCVYPEVWSGEVTREWSFQEFDDVQLRRMYGRQRVVAFRPLERRGDGFSRTVLLSFGCTVALPSMDLFRPLRDLAWAPIPYVCVRDGEGNRWYVSLRVPTGRNRRADDQGTELWVAEIGMVEVSDVPSIHDTSVAQVTEVPE
jgi:hypothetical protein